MVLPYEGPRRLAESEEVALQVFGDGERSDLFLELDQLAEGKDAGQLFLAPNFGAVKFEDVELAVLRRQSHRDGEQETIELGFRKGEGSSR